MVANILATYRQSTMAERQQESGWYAAAHLFCQEVAESTGGRTTVRQVAGIVAAISPRLSWAKNMEYARLVVETGTAPLMFGNLRKAQRIAEGADPDLVLGGRKVRSFFDNILYPGTSDTVTIDRHAVDIAFGVAGNDESRKVLAHAGVYDTVSDAYRAVGRTLGIRPLQVQAITWVTHRRIKRG